MSFAVEVEVPATVLSAPLDSFGLDQSTWDPAAPLPDQVALRWVEAEPIAPWSTALLAQIDPERLPPADLPRYQTLTQKVQSFLAAKQSRATVALAGRTDKGSRFDEVDTAAHELVVALRIPLGAAQTEVYRARRLATHLPGTQRLYDAGELTTRHVIKMIQHTGHLDQGQCAQVEDKVLDRAFGLPVHEFARRVRRAVAKVNPRTQAERNKAGPPSRT